MSSSLFLELLLLTDGVCGLLELASDASGFFSIIFNLFLVFFGVCPSSRQYAQVLVVLFAFRDVGHHLPDLPSTQSLYFFLS